MMRAAAIVPGIGNTERDGAQRLLRLVTDRQFGDRTGAYFTGDGITPPSVAASDPQVRKRLWDESAELVGVDQDWP